MDDSRHAPVMKQCMQCHHWALLTKKNWPKSSRDDPSKSCCRKCRAKGLPVEAGDSDEDVSATFQRIKLQNDGDKKVDQDRSVMSSRWAFTDEKNIACDSPKTYRKEREGAKASVYKMGSGMVANTNRKEGQKGKHTPSTDKVFKGTSSRDVPPHLDVSASRLEARQYLRSSQDNVKMENHGESRLSENNRKLLEVIEKMEKRNRDRLAMQSISNSYMQDPRHA
jgi:hypothetical protein